MNAVKINRESLLYRLAHTYGDMHEYICDDICSFRAACFKGIFLCLMIVAISSILLAPIADFLAWLVASREGMPILGVGLMIEVIAILLVISFALGTFIVNKFGVTFVPTPVQTMVQSWRERYCVPVEYVSEDRKEEV